MKKLLLLALMVFIVACNSCVPTPAPTPSPVPPAPVPTVVVDAGPQPPADAAPAPQPDVDPGVRLACENLAALHCAEGMPGCAGVLQKVINERLTAVPLGCITGATTKDQVHRCGSFVTCP